MNRFESINPGYASVFKPNRLSVGIVVPIENYGHSLVPTMQHHVERVRLVEQPGFKALWVRDVPFNVPSFGDAGQTFDPFTYLGFLAGQTSKITLGTASIALPLHHPVHVAKSAATVDQLSSGRFIMGVASGDRPSEYPAMNVDFAERGKLFEDAFNYIRRAQTSFPTLNGNSYGRLTGQMDLLPKPVFHKIPMLLTGSSRQTMEWNAQHADGWMSYPRSPMQQAYAIDQWRKLVARHHDFDKPFMQPLYVVLEKEDGFGPQPIQLGFRTGTDYLVEYLTEMQGIGVNHVAINLRFNTRDTEATLSELAEKVLPHFHAITAQPAQS
ncbi:LLM class oxidoreductase [Lewinella sp. JB7]|uniref:LLM class oxidoreductase n=1 Tax=Lewinella sp. JB7 TaxID=2962887 RepID=UPI0020CA0C29|nr:LLM class oxidoreductase [Lewinella sp. JB7]MCP9236031.1 LLM class oxidoreductase [Lewinella sp. JB7]